LRSRQTPEEEPRFVDPPGPLPSALKTRLDAMRAALASGKTTTDDVLREPTSNELRPYTEFRELIRDHANAAKTVLVPSDEPGDPLIVRLRVDDGSGAARANVRVYAYQTSAKGWYAAAAPHVGGIAGDVKHARLFGYCRTDGEGWVELTTIRPGGYPRSTLPQHIHVGLDGERDETGGGEVLFDDDPRLTGEVRARAVSEGGVVATLARSEGVQRCAVTFVLRRPQQR
jgi:protocatechuate 3,4-dioxygenase beta subunit